MFNRNKGARRFNLSLLLIFVLSLLLFPPVTSQSDEERVMLDFSTIVSGTSDEIVKIISTFMDRQVPLIIQQLLMHFKRNIWEEIVFMVG